MPDRGLDGARARLRERGAYCVKIPESAASGSPDLLACYRGRFVAIELKAPGDRPSRIQVFRGREIVAAGGVWQLVVSSHARQLVDEALDRVDREIDADAARTIPAQASDEGDRDT